MILLPTAHRAGQGRAGQGRAGQGEKEEPKPIYVFDRGIHPYLTVVLGGRGH